MAATLLIFKLSVQSSYAQNIERPADERNFDTVQWWLTDTETWRVKIFAMDDDIHTYETAGPIDMQVAIANTEKHYGDVIATRYALDFTDHRDRDEVELKMSQLGGYSTLELAPSGLFAFWNPEHRKYSSKTAPKQ